MRKLFYACGLFLVLFLWISCEKEDSSPNSLGGNTNIPLTPVNGVSSVFGSYGNQNINGGSITVVKNEDGLVTYKAVIDLNQFSNELKLKALNYLTQLSNYYKFDTAFTLAPDGKLSFEFKLKITSEGYQDFFVEGSLGLLENMGMVWELSTQLPIQRRGVSQDSNRKTGIDEWPLGFFYIKTSKIEQNAPADDPVISKVVYRINHRFGTCLFGIPIKGWYDT
ncbi:MAG: hypothetical protein IPI30_21270 [Saprospiraceae bacterium]|nr:hypothetical protein [Candidatus Vicinibacter affinis]